ncbi:MAG: TlpA family protein disulfide reductase, partial [Proteobacteria bacterium]|nr:TlpA family protein disulfide reductase [Pseudomonadota bacterium]
TELGSKNLQIIGIGVDSESNIKQFAAKYKIDYPLYVAGVSGGDLSRQLGNQAGGLPYTLLIDAQGHVRKSFLGRLHMDTLRKELAVAGLQP